MRAVLVGKGQPLTLIGGASLVNEERAEEKGRVGLGWVGLARHGTARLDSVRLGLT